MRYASSPLWCPNGCCHPVNVGKTASSYINIGVNTPSALWKAAVRQPVRFPRLFLPLPRCFMAFMLFSFIRPETFHLRLTENRFIHCFTLEKRKPHYAHILCAQSPKMHNCAKTSVSRLFLLMASDLSKHSLHLNERPMSMLF